MDDEQEKTENNNEIGMRDILRVLYYHTFHSFVLKLFVISLGVNYLLIRFSFVQSSLNYDTFFFHKSNKRFESAMLYLIHCF